jgi:undecaprenyl-diphosphatase
MDSGKRGRYDNVHNSRIELLILCTQGTIMLIPKWKITPVVFLLFFLATAGMVVLADATDGNVERETPRGMTLVQAAVLGAVEGITEYLPVSSTGHLLLAEKVMGVGVGAGGTPEESQRAKDAADAYAICIQAGAIIAVLGLYSRRVRQMFLGLAGKDRAGLQMAVNITAAFLPAAIIGFLFSKTIKAHLFGLWPVVAAWFAGGVAILVVSWTRRGHTPLQVGNSLELLRGRAALLIGLVQCIAMWPGVSRSLVTIVGGVMVGLSLPAAVEFSFLLGVVTLGAATVHDALKHGEVMLQAYDVFSIALGLLSAFVFAVFAVKWMVAYLNKNGLAVFGYYRVAVAVLVAVLLLSGVI